MLMRQPVVTNDDLLVRPVQTPTDPARLEVPEDHVALAVAGREEATVGGEVRLASVTGDGVAGKPLLALQKMTQIRVSLCPPSFQSGQNTASEYGIERTFCLKVSAPKMTTWLSRLVAASHFPFGCSPTAGIECMLGSAMSLMGTGMSKSQTRIILSSDVVMKRRFSSTKVMVLTGPRC